MDLAGQLATRMSNELGQKASLEARAGCVMALGYMAGAMIKISLQPKEKEALAVVLVTGVEDATPVDWTKSIDLVRKFEGLIGSLNGPNDIITNKGESE